MYTLAEIETQSLKFIELASSDGDSKAIVCLNQGGRLSSLVFEKIQILADYKPSSYKNNFASSILFPFANRVKDGQYTFNNLDYQLECNEADKNNALHGLVYNKTFNCIKKERTSNHASITLQYEDEGKNKGFPFKFNIQLAYTLNKKGINLSVKIINKDEKTFPFTIGWHPYFLSSNLKDSAIGFKSKLKYVFDKQQIVTGTTNLDTGMPFQLKDVILDDGYPLDSNEIEFKTPKYHFKLKASSKENFLQLYTPQDPNVIAIEPMTGAADNFNNKIGLQTLQPNNTYSVKWNMALETLNTKI